MFLQQASYTPSFGGLGLRQTHREDWETIRLKWRLERRHPTGLPYTSISTAPVLPPLVLTFSKRSRSAVRSVGK